MKDMASTSKTPKEAPVEKYPERPLEEAQADPKDIEKVENRPQVDQIADYHEKHPTLSLSKKVEQAAQDPEGQGS